MSSHRLAWLMAAALALPLAAAGQPPTSEAARSPTFDVSTVRTVQGEVAEVRRVPRGQRYQGVHLTLVTADGRVDVHLGPAGFVDARLPRLAKGDRVEVKGSEVVLDGEPALIAQAIRRGDVRVVLRNDAGFPLWSRARRR